MRSVWFSVLSFGVFASFVSNAAMAGSPASPQATPVPFNISVAGNVQVSGSDSRAASFNSDWLPAFQRVVNDNLKEQAVFTGANGFKLDSSKLFLRQEAYQTIRVYFIGEGAGYRNALGFSFTPAGSSTPGTPKLIFPNASIGSGATRTVNEPIRVGDFVEIGTGGNGWQLDFFLISDGFNIWRNNPKNAKATYLWNDVKKNSDGLQHVVAFAMPNSPYILVGFEDIVGGGDLDYNDALFVVDIGIENTKPMTNDPTSLPN
jgi:hypothetical protein